MEERYKEAKRLQKEGLTYREIAEKLNIEKGAVTYILSSKGEKNLLRKQAKKEANRIFEEKVLDVIPKSNSLNDVCAKMGLKGVNWYYTKISNIIQKYNIDTSHFGTQKQKTNGCFERLSDDVFFSENTNRNGCNLLKRLIEGNYKTHKCEKCGREEWEGEKIPLQIHHRDGDHFNNKINNLEVLCPNCHALTDTFGKRKYIEKKKKQKEKISVEDITNDLIQEKEDLLDAFKKYKSFVQVGKHYGVSDNAIRKRCKKLGILELVK